MITLTPVKSSLLTAIGRTVWEHGCVRITMQPAGMNKDGKAFDTHTTDEQNIEVLKEADPNPKPSGGPMQSVSRIADPKR